MNLHKKATECGITPSSKAENENLFRKITTCRKVVQEGKQAAERLIEGNMAYVVSKVESFLDEYTDYEYLRDDLISEGFLTLARVADNLRKSGMRIPGLWEYLSREIGVMFSVYALAMVLGGIAWSKRSIYEFPPLWKLLIFLATVPLLCFFLQRFYTGANDMLIYLHRYAAGRLAGLNVLVLAAAVNVAAALAATLFFLSRESGME